MGASLAEPARWRPACASPVLAVVFALLILDRCTSDSVATALADLRSFSDLLLLSQQSAHGSAVLNFTSDFAIAPLGALDVAVDGSIVLQGIRDNKPRPTWNLQSSSAPVVAIATGGTAAIQDLTLADAVLAPPHPLTFLQLSAVQLQRGALLTWSSVQVTTSCQRLLEYQSYACSLAALPSDDYGQSTRQGRGTLLVTPGLLRVVSWASISGITAQDVNVTCTAGGGTTGGGMATGVLPVPPCVVGSAANSAELFGGLSRLQELHSIVTLYLTDNVTLSVGAKPVNLRGNVTIRTVPGGPLLELDLALNIGAFVLEPFNLTGTLLFQDIVLVNLAVGPDEMFPASLMLGPLWAVSYDRTSLEPLVLALTGVVLVIPADAVSYMSWWASVAASPWPWIRATASWMSDYIFVSMQVSAADDHTMVLDEREGHGTQWVNCSITTQAWRTELMMASTGITALVPDKPYAPLTDASGVLNVSQLILNLQDPPASFLVLLRNLTITMEDWPTTVMPSATNVTLIGRPGDRPVFLDLGNRVNLLSLPRQLRLNRIVLLGAAPCGAVWPPPSNTSMVVGQRAECGTLGDSSGCGGGIGLFASMLWAFNFSRPVSFLNLKNVTMLLPEAEVAALSSLVLGGMTNLSSSITTELGRVLQTAQMISTSNSSLSVSSLKYLTGGQAWTNVILISGSAWGYQPAEPVPSVDLLCTDALPFKAGSSKATGSSTGPRAWQVAVIVLSVVLCVALVGLTYIIVRRVRLTRLNKLVTKAVTPGGPDKTHVRLEVVEMSSSPQTAEVSCAMVLAGGGTGRTHSSTSSFQQFMDALEDSFSTVNSNFPPFPAADIAAAQQLVSMSASGMCTVSAKQYEILPLSVNATCTAAESSVPSGTTRSSTCLSGTASLCGRLSHLRLSTSDRHISGTASGTPSDTPSGLSDGLPASSKGGGGCAEGGGASSRGDDVGSLMFCMSSASCRGLDAGSGSGGELCGSSGRLHREVDPLRSFITEKTPTMPGFRLNIDFESEIRLLTGPGDTLGIGCFGTVCKGVYNDMPVAVKIINSMHQQLVGKESVELDSFRQEVAVLSRCDHPNIVRLFGASLQPPHVCLVEELMTCSLEEVIHDLSQPLPLARVLTLARDIACGLSYLHPTVLHRDLKPGNVLLDDEGTAKLVDFGLARLRTSTLVTNHPEVGTCAYMAPECFDDRGTRTLKVRHLQPGRAAVGDGDAHAALGRAAPHRHCLYRGTGQPTAYAQGPGRVPAQAAQID